MRRACSIVVLMVSCGVPFLAQSLGDVARQEEARRKAIAKPARVYTNESLKIEPAPDAPVVAAQAPAAPGSEPAATPQPASPSQAQAQPGSTPSTVSEPDETRTEPYWRRRVAAVRDGLERARMFQDALQSRINGLTTDFVNRDDPAQRQVIASDRQKALAELDRVKGELQQSQKALTDMQEEARRASVPPGWLR